jgi:hypothetical protein
VTRHNCSEVRSTPRESGLRITRGGVKTCAHANGPGVNTRWGGLSGLSSLSPSQPFLSIAEMGGGGEVARGVYCPRHEDEFGPLPLKVSNL